MRIVENSGRIVENSGSSVLQLKLFLAELTGGAEIANLDSGVGAVIVSCCFSWPWTKEESAEDIS